MLTVTITNTGQELEANQGDNLLHLLRCADVWIDNACNGTGTCGKCKIKILEGAVSKVEETEGRLLKAQEIESGIRLACMVEIQSNLQVELLEKEKVHRVLTRGKVPEFERDTWKTGYGVAVDIGTTTVVASLVDLKTGMETASVSGINEQKKYGLDILTRITYEYENPETGCKQLQKAIVDMLNVMLDNLCYKNKINKQEIKEIDVAANCTMMHMLLGVDARTIGRAPYQPVFLDAQKLAATEIGLKTAEDTILYCLPQVSAYIGADIVAGAYVCSLQKEKENTLFIDIGTNGEIVLTGKDNILCCSCAAGPALEGMNISCGMRAAEGAVEDVQITEKGIRMQTIGNREPIGICGSGILAVLKELLRTGFVKKTGVFIKKESLPETDYRKAMIRMNGKKREFILQESPELIVTQGDIRQVQLAKGAIRSGFTALLNAAGIKEEELQKVIIAGQFGAHLPAELLTGTGILPEDVEGRLNYVGNSSKTGAYMALLSETVKKEIEQLARKMKYIELSKTENYERIFTESMIFPSSKTK